MDTPAKNVDKPTSYDCTKCDGKGWYRAGDLWPFPQLSDCDRCSGSGVEPIASPIKVPYVKG